MNRRHPLSLAISEQLTKVDLKPKSVSPIIPKPIDTKPIKINSTTSKDLFKTSALNNENPSNISNAIFLEKCQEMSINDSEKNDLNEKSYLEQKVQKLEEYLSEWNNKVAQRKADKIALQSIRRVLEDSEMDMDTRGALETRASQIRCRLDGFNAWRLNAAPTLSSIQNEVNAMINAGML